MTSSGPDVGLASVALLRDAQSRAISPENFTGAKGQAAAAETGTASEAARDLGRGWKVSPYILLPAGETFELANIDGRELIVDLVVDPRILSRYVADRDAGTLAERHVPVAVQCAARVDANRQRRDLPMAAERVTLPAGREEIAERAFD